MGEVRKQSLNTAQILWLLQDPERINERQNEAQKRGDVDLWLQLGQIRRSLKTFQINDTTDLTHTG
jgi:hypothetical protein